MMSKWIGWIGATLGAIGGGWLGAHVSLFIGFVLSVVGTGAGLYAGRRIAATLE